MKALVMSAWAMLVAQVRAAADRTDQSVASIVRRLGTYRGVTLAGSSGAIDRLGIGRYRSRSAAATTAATIGSHSKPGSRVTVTKSFTP